MLTAQFRESVDAGLFDRKVFGEVPPKVEYSISIKGVSIFPILKAIEDWGKAKRRFLEFTNSVWF